MAFYLIKNIKFSALLILSILFQLVAQNNDNDFWKPFFEEGFIYMQQGKIDEAESEFNKILEMNDKIPEAYYGLGLVYNQKEPGGKTAEEHFKKAVKLNKEFALAYYQLAVVNKYRRKLNDVRENLQKAVKINPTLANAWLELVDVQESLIQDSESIVNILESAFRHVPNNPTLSTKYVDACIWYDRDKQAIKTLRSLDKKNLNVPENLYQLSRLEFISENYDESLNLIDSLKQKYPHFSKSRLNLLLAKIYLAINKSDDFYSAYIDALNNIRNKTEATLFFNDLCYIMKDDEFEELLTISVEAVSDFYLRFWRSRDPNLSTKENERISEHYRRLAYARKNYRRYTKNPEKYENVYATEHPFALHNAQGTGLLKEAFFPKALPQIRDLDDLGIIYIRHGEPDLKVTSPKGIPDYVDETRIEDEIEMREFYSEPHLISDGAGDTLVSLSVESYGIPVRPVSTLRVPRAYMGETLLSQGYIRNMPMNVSLKYRSRYDRPEMIFHFKKYLGVMGWIIEAIPYTVADREILSSLYLQLGKESFNTLPNETFVTNISNEIKAINIKNVEIAMTKETPDFKFEAEPLEFPMDLITFKFREQNNLIELYYGLDGQQVALTNNGDGNCVELSKFVGIYDEKWNEIRWLNKDDVIPVNQTSDMWQQFAGVDVARFAVKPGKYFYEIQLKDKTSGRLGVYRGDIQVADYWNGTLQMSDIILSGAIKPAENETKFRKEDITYSPHMFTDFKANETVGIYFELYNLDINSSGESNFSITSTLQPSGQNNSPAAKISGFFKSILGDEEGIIGTSYEYSGKDKDDKIFINFDIGDKKAGDYELVIETIDLNSNTTVSKKIGLTIS